MRIIMIGVGYVGLVTGVCFAEMGYHVTCIDIDSEKIDRLKQGISPIYEPGLQELLQKNLAESRISFSTHHHAVAEGQLCFLALPTPQLPNGACNLSYLEEAIAQIAPHIQDNVILINKSTAPIGTSEYLGALLLQHLHRLSRPITYHMVSNPEFLKEGNAVEDCMKPDRIIIGTDSPYAREMLHRLYAPFTFNRNRILDMDPRSAEMAKYASNSMLATRISFMNEIASLCEHFGANIDAVRIAMGADRRIGPSFLYAGAGYGGSCFPKDIQALRALAHQHHIETPLLDATHRINEVQKMKLGHWIDAYFHGILHNKTIGIWGLTYKPQTDDVREAPSLSLIRFLLDKRTSLQLFDPIGMKNAKKNIPPSPLITWCSNEYEAAQNVDALVLMTEWKQFRVVDLNKVKQLMRGSAFFDGRNQYQPKEMFDLGFEYISIGRQHIPVQLSHH